MMREWGPRRSRLLACTYDATPWGVRVDKLTGVEGATLTRLDFTQRDRDRDRERESVCV
jgi:hypothetical protein